MQDVAELVRDRVRAIPDYPSPGIVFRDITPLLADGPAFARVVDALAAPYRGGAGGPTVDVVAGIEARGFILAAPVALALGVGFVPIRKKGKLPHTTVGAGYDLEYGRAEIEMHADGVRPGQRVLVMDDVLATGGTAEAACALVEQLGAGVAAVSVLLEIAGLPGRERLTGRDVHCLLAV
jgi:adenine phosphoribosyltransferase